MTEAAPETIAVRQAHDFDRERLETYLSAAIPGFTGPLQVSQFVSGQSNPTFLLTTPSASYVLRKKPPGELLPSAHQVEREYKIMAALRNTAVPVPEVLHLCLDAAVIGTTFFIMKYVQGRIFKDPSLPGVSPDQRAIIFDATAKTLAALHSVDIESAGLSDYGRRESFVARQVKRWTGQYEASKSADLEIVEMEKVAGWLAANIPQGDAEGDLCSIVHGDFRLDNIIFHPDRSEVLAVLDWELSTLGNPLSDLGYFLMLYLLPSGMPAVPGLAGCNLHELGIPGAEGWADTYLKYLKDSPRFAHFAVDSGSEKWLALKRFFIVFALFRLACIAQGVYARARAGIASAANAEEVGRMAAPCAQLAWRLVNSNI